MRIFIRAVDFLSWLGGLIAMALLAGAVLIVCQMIVMRYVLNASTVWQTEFVIYSIVAATFLGAAHVLVQKGHVGVDLLPALLGGKGKRVLELVSGLLSLVFLAVLTYAGWIHFAEAWTRNWTTETVWALPLWIPLLPLPLGMGLLCLQYIAEMLRIVTGQERQAATHADPSIMTTER